GFATYFAFDSARHAEQARDNEARAKNNEQKARQNAAELAKTYDELQGTLARTIFASLAMQPGQPLDPEGEVLAELAAHQRHPVGVRVVERALQGPEYSRQLKNRGAPTFHAVVGLRASQRGKVERMLIKRLQERELTREQRTDLALAAVELGGLTP